MTGVEEEEELDSSGFVEVDPTGRYGRYNEILGKGASKTVYKAFDEYEGIEVAWNQVKLYDFLQSPEDLERLYCEIHLLKTLKHENIMKFYSSWVDIDNRNINFVTEMFTSGTLRQYRLKHRRVSIRAVKQWCRQILKGLLYLHSHDPPIIHRDLKCDNIFVNGNQGEVKIGDLGLAAILRKSHAARCVGTPEFMAPEVYQEEYNELVDIYSFGMCVLEMVTFEYPYSECTHPAQIYKKVVSGKKPEAFYKVKDPEVRQFVEKCLATVSSRLSARELLMDPFLQVDDFASDLVSSGYPEDANGVDYCDDPVLIRFSGYDRENEQECHHVELQRSETDLFSCQGDDHLANLDISIKGQREDSGIFLRLRIVDKDDRIRNIYFPFDIEVDTAISVATEMVSELELTNQDAFKIADMIDGEITTLVPGWRGGHAEFCHNCSSQGCPLDCVATDSPAAQSVQVIHCSRPGCSHVHSRFEEVTYQVGGPEECEDTQCYTRAPSESVAFNYIDIHCDEGGDSESHDSKGEAVSEKEEKIITMDSLHESNARSSISSMLSAKCSHWDDYESEIRQELRWLKAKYQMQLSQLRDQQLRGESKSSNTNPSPDNAENKRKNGAILPLLLPKSNRHSSPIAHGEQVASFPCTYKEITCSSSAGQMAGSPEANGSRGPHDMFTAKSFYGGVLLPHSLQRATSLPVDAIDV